MIKHKFFKIVLVCSVIMLTACGTTSAPEPSPAPEKEAPVVTEKPKQKKEEKKKEPEDPPNVKFAKELQKLLDKGDIEGAINHFEKIPSELSNDVELKLLLGALYYSAGQYDNAITVANEVLAEYPDNMDALELISLSNRAKGDKAAYRATADQILKVDPNNTAVNVQKAEEYALNKKYKQAREAYRKALKGDPSDEDAMFGFAQMSFYTDDLKTAVTYFQKILDKNPNDPDALAYMGKIAYDQENYLKACEYIEEALKYAPDNYDYWMDYGTYLRYRGKFEEAAKAWNKAVEIDPTYFLAYAYLAGSYDDLGKWDLALENYHKVIQTNPKYFYAYESAAILEYHAENYKEAIKLFTKAYECSPSWSYTLMIAASYYKMKDSLNAKKVLAAQLKKMDSSTTEYSVVRFFNDPYSKNAESTLNQKIAKETNSNNRGKMLFYMGLFCEINNAKDLAKEYYAKVTKLQAPMFFEYRIAEWGLEK